MRDLELIVERLRSPEAKTRAGALRVLAEEPTGDPRVRAEVERLLADTAVAVVMLPYHYAEVRFVAAEALAAERAKAGIREIVHFDRIVWPLSEQKLVNAAREAGIPLGRGGVEGQLELFRALRDADKLPTRRYDNPNPWLEKREQAIAALHGAIQAAREGRPIEGRCIFCDGLLQVTPVPPEQPTRWEVTCPCGESRATVNEPSK